MPRSTYATRTPLGELELLVLLILRRPAEGSASGIQVTLGLEARRHLSLGTICKTLQRLETKGFACSRTGERRPVPGGRRQKLYSPTPAGIAALDHALAVLHRMSRGAPVPPILSLVPKP